MNRDKLIILMNALYSEQEKKDRGLSKFWDFSYFAINRNEDGKEKFLGDCGTSGCALGMATLLFPNELGVCWSKFRVSNNKWGTIIHRQDGSEDLVAASSIFDIDIKTAEAIFAGNYFYGDDEYAMPRSNVSPKMVADRIKLLLRQNGKFDNDQLTDMTEDRERPYDYYDD